MRSFLSCLGFVASTGLVVACGSSDKSRTKEPLDDGGAGGRGTGGGSAAGGRVASGGAGTGGASAGGAAAGGASAGGAAAGGASAGGSGAGGVPEAGPDGSLDGSPPDAAPEAEASVPELVCPDGGAPGIDGGDGGSYWRDFAAGVCRACPAATLTCDDLLASPGPVYDPVTRMLTVNVTPGVTEVVTAELGIRFANEGGLWAESATVPASVRQNTLTADLSNALPPTKDAFRGFFTVTDACGQTVETNAGGAARELQVTLTPLDGGAPGVTTECYSTD